MNNTETEEEFFTVNPLRLAAQIIACRVHVRSGGAMKLTRNAPTVAALRGEYGIPSHVRTFAAMLECLLILQADVDLMIEESKLAQAGLR